MIAGPSPAPAGWHVVIVELAVRPERLEAFLGLARSFAAECRGLEPGCRQFEVVVLDAPQNHVLFFETYDDDAAFNAHRHSDHLQRFKEAFKDMVMSEQPLRKGRC